MFYFHKMNDETLLKKHGWILISESPLEIEHEGTGSGATGYGAKIVIESLKKREKKK